MEDDDRRPSGLAAADAGYCVLPRDLTALERLVIEESRLAELDDPSVVIEQCDSARRWNEMVLARRAARQKKAEGRRQKAEGGEAATVNPES